MREQEKKQMEKDLKRKQEMEDEKRRAEQQRKLEQTKSAEKVFADIILLFMRHQYQFSSSG